MGDDGLEKLGHAATSLRSAEELVEDDEVGEQLGSQADHLSDLAERDRAPDQERVNQHQHSIRDLHEQVRSDDARAHVSRALDHVTSVEDTIDDPPGPG